VATTRGTRRTLWFWLALAVTLYVIVSVGVAVSTADACDGGLDGQKTWQPFPPRWECGLR
jgi:hypothetical protein